MTASDSRERSVEKIDSQKVNIIAGDNPFAELEEKRRQIPQIVHN